MIEKDKNEETFSLKIASHYTQRVFKDYQMAFDIVSNSVQDQNKYSPILAIVDLQQWAVELIRRLNMSIHLCPTQYFDVEIFFKEAQAWTQADLGVVNSNQQNQYKYIIWVTPLKVVVNNSIDLINNNSNDGSKLILISPGILSQLLPKAYIDKNVSKELSSQHSVSSLLTENGWKLQNRIGVHGLRSIFYGICAQAVSLINRTDWHDRCVFSSRSVYKTSGLLWPLSTVIVSSYQKEIETEK